MSDFQGANAQESDVDPPRDSVVDPPQESVVDPPQESDVDPSPNRFMSDTSSNLVSVLHVHRSYCCIHTLRDRKYGMLLYFECLP